MLPKQNQRSFHLPVPSNVIAKETEERPLIRISTANGERRPILHKNIFIFFQLLLNCYLLISDNQSDNKGKKFD